MEMVFDVEERSEGGVELIPDFFKAELPKQSFERDVYRWYLRRCTFENGALVLHDPECDITHPPERITLREFEERHNDRFGYYWSEPVKQEGLW